MSEELLINVSPVESRIAVLNNGVVSEIYIERHNKLGLVGNIYLGTVVRVLPGMQAAFIDIGQSRTAFLHVNDMQRLPKPAPTLSELPDISHTEPKKPTLLTSLTVDHPDKVAEQTATDASNKTANATVNSTVNSTVVTEAQNSSGEQVTVSNFNDSNEKANSGATINALPLTEDDAVESIVKPSPLSASISQVVAEASLTNNSQALNSYITNFATNPLNQASTDDIKQSASLAASTDIQNELQRVDVSNIGLSHPIHVNNINSDKGLGEKKSALTDESSNLDEALTDSLNVGSSNNTQLPSADGNQKVEQQQVENHSGSKQVPKHELIQNRLHQGQKILVQVTKDQLGTKGARLTTNISLPSRFLVYIPSSEHIGISQRIDNEEERTRLKSELSTLMSTFNLQGGVIARTAAERVAVSKLEEDIYYLVQLWRSIQARKNEAALTSHPSTLIYQELSLPLRAIRDLVHPETEKVIVDNQKIYEQVKQFAREFVPSIEPRIIPYTSDQPLFDVHRVEDDLRDALKRRVDLKSGGYLVIDQTEAMTTIDVNTGSYVGARSLEDTVYKTNLEATHAIAHQLRLRNLGGIIILDFIDMSEQEHKDDVLNSLQARLAQDYAKTKITQVSELGLVEMTRKRTRESLEQQLCEPCQTCQGKGFIKTAETVCFEIFREIMRCARTYDSPKKFTVVAHAAVIDLLLSSEADTVADLEYLVGRVITFEVEDLYTQEQYDIVLD